MKKMDIKIIIAMPIKIRILPGSSKLINTPGKQIKERMLSVKIANVYIVRFKINETVTATPEIPSLCIKYALAGWPPVAEGVMEEK